ncbi:MAG: hypothetical protein LUP95_01505 [Euryarchaeota archaeon]|nr:hypothetical protein [Euryarchaeota archaeon]
MVLMRLHALSYLLIPKRRDREITFESASGFKITYLTRCKTDKNESTSVKLYIYLTDYAPVDAVTVSTDESFDEYATLDTVTQRYTDAILGAYTDLTVVEKGHATLGGHPAFHTVYTGTITVHYGDEDMREETLKINQAWTIRQGRAYLVTFKALIEDYDRYLAQAQRIIDSFTLV